MKSSHPSSSKSTPKLPGLPALPDNPIIRAAKDVVERLQAAGHEAYFVGGFVRDWLLGIEHYDVDIATSAPPEQVEALFENTREVGRHFGVVLVTVNDATLEVATFRIDDEYIDYRRPKRVHYGTLEDDAARRDFTINALYYDPVGHRLIDLHAGKLDLRRRILRTVGAPPKRFDEDALRLMRAVRFAVRYELEIEPITRKAIARKAKNLAEISAERIGEELLRIATGPNPGRGVRLMEELGLWKYVIPEIAALKGVDQGKNAHPEGDVFEHTVRVVENLPEDPPPALALAALLHDIGKPRTYSREGDAVHFYGHQRVGAAMAREICARLRYSRELTDRVVDLVEHHMMFMQVRGMKTSTLKRFLSRPNFQLLLDLHKADSLASDGELDAYDYCVNQRKALAVEHGSGLKPEALADGDDLIAMGLQPGPIFRRLLDDLHDEQLEGRVSTRAEALEYLRRRAEELRR